MRVCYHIQYCLFKSLSGLQRLIADSDLILEYTLTITLFKYDDPLNEIFYDELRMVTSSKVEAKDDILYFTLLKNKLEIDNKFG